TRCLSDWSSDVCSSDLDASFKRDVAMKILRHELSEPQQMLRFRAEFSTLVTLDHPSIIKVHDFGLLQDRFPYFTMEFFSGKKIEIGRASCRKELRAGWS